MPTLWFFERLGLAPTNDIKSIKRAYAVALKRIDQQHDREGFETLRRAYEQASAWARDAADDSEGSDDSGDSGDSDDSGDTGDSGDSDDSDDDTWTDEDQRDIDSDGDPENLAPDVDEDATERSKSDEPPSAADTLADILGVPSSSVHVHLGQPPHDDPFQDEREPAFDSRADLPSGHDGESLRQQQADTRAALDEWMARLLDAGDQRVESVLAQAVSDPRMSALDSQIALEQEIAHALHHAPAGHAALFDAAATRFGWTERNARPQVPSGTASWISRVINQTLQWEAQEIAIIAGRNNTLRVVTQTEQPSRKQAYEYWPLLRSLQQQFPEWLALRLSPEHMQRWEHAYASLSAGWLARRKWRAKLIGSSSRVITTLLLASLVLGLVIPMVKTALKSGSNPSQTTPASQPSQSPAAAQTAEPVLAYEITGPVTRDSCETTHEFVHESNWLEVDDPDAIGLLATRMMLCQDRSLWPQKDDPLAQCLRQARLSALSAAAPERLATCATPAAPGAR